MYRIMGQTCQNKVDTPLELCKGMWLARQRDPSVTMESVPDVYTVQYGVKNGGSLGAIPLNVQELLLPYKEFHL
jgi:hypothetical protein